MKVNIFDGSITAQWAKIGETPPTRFLVYPLRTRKSFFSLGRYMDVTERDINGAAFRICVFGS